MTDIGRVYRPGVYRTVERFANWKLGTVGGEGGIRTHGASNRTTAFETAPSQILTGGKVNSRWLQAPDLNLHLKFQERMITADSLLRYHLSPVN